MKVSSVFLLLFVALFLLATGCSGTGDKSPQTRATVLATGENQVLLAYEETRFKNALIDRMKSLLEGSGFSVTVVRHSEAGFAPGDVSACRAVFITSSGVNSKVRPWITQWLEQNRPLGKIVLLHVTQKSDWKVSAEVDTVTSASAVDDVERLASEYVDRLKKIMTPAPGAAPADGNG